MSDDQPQTPASNPADSEPTDARPSSGSHEIAVRKLSGRAETLPAKTGNEDSSADDTGRASIVSAPATPQPDPQRLLFTPTIDIFNTDDGLVLRADLPGVCVERLDLQIQDNKLTLFGRVQENLPDGARPLHREYQVGDFYRSFILSDEVAYERISAKMNLGVLEITLPRIPRAEPRKIPVQSE